MIYEMRIYTMVPGGLAEYLKSYNELGRPVQTEILGNLVGMYQTEVGELNQLIYIWGYPSYEDRIQRRKTLLADERFATFRKSVRHLLQRQESRLMNEA